MLRPRGGEPWGLSAPPNDLDKFAIIAGEATIGNTCVSVGYVLGTEKEKDFMFNLNPQRLCLKKTEQGLFMLTMVLT